MNRETNPLGRERDLFLGIDIVPLLLLLESRWKKIVLVTFLVTFAAGIYVWLATPKYRSAATISLKQQESGGVQFALNQFTMLGATNSPMTKVEIILKSYELAEQVILANDLMPELYPDRWDMQTKAWKDSTKVPELHKGVSKLRNKVIDVKLRAKQGVIEVSAEVSDSLLAKRIVDYYLIELNHRIRENVMSMAESDRRYLEEQLANTFDPLLAEKLRSMVAIQIERAMLVSSKAFEIVEGSRVPNSPYSPQRRKILVLAFLGGIALSVAGVLFWQSVQSLRYALNNARLAKKRALREHIPD